MQATKYKRFFIWDCNGNVAGNPNGYPTFRGAQTQAESRKSKAYNQIKAAYDASEKQNASIDLVYKIKLEEK